MGRGSGCPVRWKLDEEERLGAGDLVTSAGEVNVTDLRSREMTAVSDLKLFLEGRKFCGCRLRINGSDV